MLKMIVFLQKKKINKKDKNLFKPLSTYCTARLAQMCLVKSMPYSNGFSQAYLCREKWAKVYNKGRGPMRVVVRIV